MNLWATLVALRSFAVTHWFYDTGVSSQAILCLDIDHRGWTKSCTWDLLQKPANKKVPKITRLAEKKRGLPKCDKTYCQCGFCTAFIQVFTGFQDEEQVLKTWFSLPTPLLVGSLSSMGYTYQLVPIGFCPS